jgi:hypothetical protein
MGRFYKATPRNFIDNKMFETPFEEIAATLGTLDRNIDETYDEGITLRDSIESKKLDVDDPAVQERYQHYEDIVENSTAAMDKDPLSFIKHRGKLRRASRELSTEMKSGLIGRADEQHEARAARLEEVNKRTDISEESKQNAMIVQDLEYGDLNFNPEDKSYNKFNDSKRNLIPEVLDEESLITKIAANIKKDSTRFDGGSYATSMKGIDGAVIMNTSTSRGEVTKSRVLIAAQGILDDTNYEAGRQQYYQLKLDAGNLESTLGADGAEMTPEELADRDAQNFLDKAVSSLTRQEGNTNSRATSESSVTGKSPEKEPDYSIEVVNNIEDSVIRESNKTITSDIDNLIKEEKIRGYTSGLDLAMSVTNEAGQGRTLTQAWNSIADTGKFTSKKEFVTWVNRTVDANTISTVAPIAVLNTWNDGADKTADSDIFIKSDGEIAKLSYQNLAEMVEAGANGKTDEEFFIPITGARNGDAFYRRQSQIVNGVETNSGPLVDVDGNVIMMPAVDNLGWANDTDAYPATDVSQVADKTLLVVDKQKVADFSMTGGGVLNATQGELKTSSRKHTNAKGELTEINELKQTKQVLRFDPVTNEFKFLTLQIVVDPTKFGLQL